MYLGCWARTVFERVGLFDPDLVRNQDDEFNFRLRRLGGRIWQSPRIKSSYAPRTSVGPLFRQYLQYGFWKVAVIRKHRALACWRHVVPVVFVSWILGSLAGISLAALLGVNAVAFGIAAALATGLSVYLLACAASTLPFARSLEPRALLIVPGVIAVCHAAYGLGFLIGVLKFTGRGSCGIAPARLFTALTR